MTEHDIFKWLRVITNNVLSSSFLNKLFITLLKELKRLTAKTHYSFITDSKLNLKMYLNPALEMAIC